MKLAIRLIISLFILSWLFHIINFHEVLPILKQVKWDFLILALCVQLSSVLFAVIRWQSIMETLKFFQSKWFFYKSYLKGMLFNQVLPTSVGGDAYRVIEIGNHNYNKKQAFFGVMIDRIFGTLGLLTLSIIANLLLPNVFPKKLFILINIIIWCGVLGTVFLYYTHKIKFLHGWHLLNWFVELSASFSQAFSSFWDFSYKVILSILSNLGAVLAVYCVALALHVQAHLITFILIVPLVNLLTLIPISFAGWGVREGAMIGLFAFVGIAKPVILMVSIIYGILLIIASIPGLYFYLTHKPLSLQGA